MAVVVLSYRQNVHAYPSGGGDYEVASDNLGRPAGLVVGSALLADYVLTVAVSVSSGTDYLVSMIPSLDRYSVWIALAVIAFLTVLNLRGIRESGKALAFPVYGFMAAIGITVLTGLAEDLTGHLHMAESAAYSIVPTTSVTVGLGSVAGMFLLARAFSSGSAALTGVEAISNGVPNFRKPKSRNAATTLAILGTISVTMMLAITILANRTGVHYVQNPATELVDQAGNPAGAAYQQHPAISQIALAVFHSARPLFFIVAGLTCIILFLAANTAFNGFPTLASVLARDSYLPHQLRRRGDRLAYSNGILLLAVAAALLVFIFQANVNRLIQLYIVGVFISFTTSQFGMIRHWGRLLRLEPSRRRRFVMWRSRIINIIGFLLTATVLIVVLITKFTRGAWMTLLLMAILFLWMNRVHAHYTTVSEELAVQGDPADARKLPSRVHAIVLVSKLNRPAMRAIAYARATRPAHLEVITVGVSDTGLKTLRADWDRLGVPLPLTVIGSPYRAITRPVTSHIHEVKKAHPDELIVVYIPEYVVAHRWQEMLHNQTALRLTLRLRRIKKVVVATVPWIL
ncbi:MAG: APC family permease, partial [Bifidobacteriaceae bacterium]|nr:APC family permease [Bifidobacteriaceae bacterium]